MFYHSSSYTANPIACAAAAANLDVWECEPVRERVAALTAAQAPRLAPLSHNARFSNVRQVGAITAVDFEAPQDGYLSAVGPKLYDFFLGRGLLLRPLGNTVYVMPPYCTTAGELDAVYAAIADAAEVVGR
jgi:adenosylmethionine---8-amino-7-oxononanoate aminotransferase